MLVRKKADRQGQGPRHYSGRCVHHRAVPRWEACSYCTSRADCTSFLPLPVSFVEGQTQNTEQTNGGVLLPSFKDCHHLTTPTKSSHCCCTSHHQFCQKGPEPRISYPNWMSREVYKHLAHIAWTREDETLDCGIDRQQHPTDDVFMANIVALGMSMGREEVMDEEVK